MANGKNASLRFSDFEIDLGRTGRAYNSKILAIAETYGDVWHIAEDLEDKHYSFNRREVINFSKYLIRECLRLIEEQGMGSGAAPRAMAKIKKRFGILDPEVEQQIEQQMQEQIEQHQKEKRNAEE